MCIDEAYVWLKSTEPASGPNEGEENQGVSSSNRIAGWMEAAIEMEGLEEEFGGGWVLKEEGECSHREI